MRARTRPRQAGFTVLEVTISASLLGVIVIAGTQMAGGAVESTRTDVRESDQAARLSRSTDGVVAVLATAGASTLWGIPVDGETTEPMLANVVYERISYRNPVGYADGAVVYDPPINEDPDEVFFDPDGGGVDDTQRWGTEWGTLFLLQDGAQRALRSPVRDVTFARERNVLILNFETLRDDEHKTARITRKIHLHAR